VWREDLPEPDTPVKTTNASRECLLELAKLDHAIDSKLTEPRGRAAAIERHNKIGRKAAETSAPLRILRDASTRGRELGMSLALPIHLSFGFFRLMWFIHAVVIQLRKQWN
jgi:hypothetical protein